MQHPLEQLGPDEVLKVSEAVKGRFEENIRFSVVTLQEPPKDAMLKFNAGEAERPPRQAYALVLVPSTGIAFELVVNLFPGDPEVVQFEQVEGGQQPLISPDDCFLAEEIVKGDEKVAALLKERYGIEDLALLACDPWSVHVTDEEYPPLGWRNDGVPPRLVQTFLYMRNDAADNHYAHPIDLLPVVDLNARRVVHMDMQEVAPEIPKASVNYHRDKVASNSYPPSAFTVDPPKPLEVVQPEGASFTVDGSEVRWQKWSFRVGFNYREGLVIHDARFDSRPVMWRGSLVEMAVPYGDPNEPFPRKCAFDVGDYGLGFCTNSLELGCDCLGYIHYFDGTLSDRKGEPYTVRKVVCMHEEDDGLLWKHVEYRNGHSEARRSHRLVLSFIATVVNYEYLFYWYFTQDGRIELEIKLSGELSTNLVSAGEQAETPGHGVLVAPGVNAQLHQHMFCARLDMCVDGPLNTVCEVDVVREDPPPPPSSSDDSNNSNRHGNAFQARYKTLTSEKQARRDADPALARVWLVRNEGKRNPVNGRAVGYKLVPQTRGPAHPLLLPWADSSVGARGGFATHSLWVTPQSDLEQWPAGKFTAQSRGGGGLPEWTEADRPVENKDVVLWHCFGLVHVPRPEDFPVMPCESTGFTLKPDSFFAGNPTIDLPPNTPGSGASKCCSNH